MNPNTPQKYLPNVKYPLLRHRYWGLAFLVVLLTNPTNIFGQKPDLVFINSEGDTITQQFDTQGRVIKEYVNRIISKEIEYINQDSVVLADLIVKAGRFENIVLKYTLEKGDSIFIDICEKKGRKFKRIDFIQGEKGFLYSRQGESKFKFDELITLSDEYTISIQKMLRVFKRKYKIKVTHIPKAVPKVTNYVIDTVLTSITIPDTLLDTLLLPVMEDVIYIPPMRDIENTSFRIKKIEFPMSTDSLFSFSYWVGAGNNMLQEYDQLANRIPENWTQKGVTKPLGAYVLGAKILLPKPNHSYVRLMVGDSLQMLDYQRSFTSESFKELPESTFDKDIILSPNDNNNLFLFLANNDTVNGYNVYIKVIAAQLLKTVKTKELDKKVIYKPRPIKENESVGQD